jgi:hypothetical protein
MNSLSVESHICFHSAVGIVSSEVNLDDILDGHTHQQALFLTCTGN